LHVLQLPQLVSDFDGHRRVAETKNVGSAWRLQHDVRANAFDAFGGFRQQPGSQANDQHHQRNLDGNGEDTYESASRTVQ